MSLTRRYSAAVLAASVMLLGACGGEAPANPTPEIPEIGDNPRIISLSPGSMVFSSMDVVPGPQTLAVSGLVAIGSAVSFGTTNYTQAVTPWLRVNPAPVFQREPLAWLHTVSIDAAAYGALPNGVYTATVPVIVVAALNSPQQLHVTLCKGSDACLSLGSSVMGALTLTDPTWDRHVATGSIFDPFDIEAYDDWVITLLPGEWSYIQMLGGGCGEFGGTLGDPYLFVYEGAITDITDWIDVDDDTDCLNSEVYIENNSLVAKFYTIRATSFTELPGGVGTYTLRSSLMPFLRIGEPQVPVKVED